MTEPMEPPPPPPLDGPSAEMLCNEAPVSGLDGGSPLFECDEAPVSGLDGGSPLFECNEAPVSGLDAAAPLMLCNEAPASGLDGPSAQLQCNGSPPEAPPPPARPGLMAALVGGAALLIGAGLYVGGVFDSGTTATPAALTGTPTPGLTPAPTGSPVSSGPTPTRTPGATVSPTHSPGYVEPTRATVLVSGTRSPLPRVTPAASHSPTATAQPTATQPAAAPKVGSPSAKPGAIWELNKKGSCGPTTSTVTVTVTDPAAISSVVLSWSVNGQSGSTAMSHTGGSSYQATFGDFPDTTIATASDSIALTVKAKDSGGRTGSSSSTMTLNGC